MEAIPGAMEREAREMSAALFFLLGGLFSLGISFITFRPDRIWGEGFDEGWEAARERFHGWDDGFREGWECGVTFTAEILEDEEN